MYAARRIADGLRVALKVLPLRASAERTRARFEVEILAHHRVTHPGVLPILDEGLDDDNLWFAMPWLDGQTLADIIAEGTASFEQRIQLLVDVARALQAAHEVGVLHRDVKPSNVFVTNRGEAKVLDFSIAKLDDIDLTMTDATNGTPRYMAPEQVLGHALDARTDVFALAIVAYELLSGRLPWRSSTPYEAIAAICKDAPEPFTDVVRSAKSIRVHHTVLAALHATIHRGLEKDPSRRPASMDAFADELLSAVDLASAAHRARPATPVARVALKRRRVVELHRPAETAGPSARWRPTLVSGAGIAGLSVLIGCALSKLM